MSKSPRRPIKNSSIIYMGKFVPVSTGEVGLDVPINAVLLFLATWTLVVAFDRFGRKACATLAKIYGPHFINALTIFYLAIVFVFSPVLINASAVLLGCFVALLVVLFLCMYVCAHMLGA